VRPSSNPIYHWRTGEVRGLEKPTVATTSSSRTPSVPRSSSSLFCPRALRGGRRSKRDTQITVPMQLPWQDGGIDNEQ